MPAVTLVLHLPGAFNSDKNTGENARVRRRTSLDRRVSYFCFSVPTRDDGFLAVVALGGVFVGIALGAQQLLILGGEGFVHQGALALEALEAFLMPVAVFVRQILPG